MTEEEGLEMDRRNQNRRANDSHESWHMKKEVPIATILAIFISISTGAFYISGLQAGLEMVNHDLIAHKQSDMEREGRQERADREMLSEMREMRKDLTSIKISIAGNGINVKRNNK